MRDTNTKAKVNWEFVDEWVSRPRTPRKFPFTYNWSHTATGNSGSGTIFMASYKMLEEWIARWNHSNFANGWLYYLPKE